MLCGTNTVNNFFNFYYHFIVANIPRREEYSFLLCAKTWSLRGKVPTCHPDIPGSIPWFTTMNFYLLTLVAAVPWKGTLRLIGPEDKWYKIPNIPSVTLPVEPLFTLFK